MKAWQFTTVGEEITKVEVPDPVAGPGEVVIDVRAAGLCHTDISFIDGQVPGMPTHLPIVLGHEVAGVVSALGEGVTGVSIGDRVGIAPHGIEGPGVGRDGGYAEKTIGQLGELVPVPETVNFAQAAAATDAGATAYHAVVVAGGVAAGMKVGIIGLGGLGQIGARVAVLQGAEVHVSDVRPELETVATSLGAAGFVTDVSDLAGLGLDVVIDFAGFDTTRAAIAAARPGGRVVQIGAGNPEATISVVDFVVRGITMVGSLGGTKADVEAVYGLLATGSLDPVVSLVDFDSIAEGLQRLRRGEAEGRTVALIG